MKEPNKPARPSTAMDAFDLLGVGSREDSYTDLLVNGFTLEREFRRRFLQFLGERDGDAWVADKRPRITRAGLRRAEVPDIVLSNRDTQRLLVIENKIWSGEGENQLANYGDGAFKAALSKRVLDADEAPDDSRLIFLTMDLRDVERSGPAELVTYDDLCAEVFSEPIPSGSRVADLLNQMAARIRARSEWRIDLSRPLEDMFEAPPAMLPDRERLEAFVLQSVPSGAYSSWSDYVDNPQHGTTPMVKLNSPRWQQPSGPNESFGGSHDVHFEFQWLVTARGEQKEGLSAEVHFETNPYRTMKVGQRNDAEYARFKSRQGAFREAFFEANPAGWKRPRTSRWVNVAVLDHQIDDSHFWIPPDLECGRARELIQAAIHSAASAIDAALTSPRFLDARV